MFISRQGYEKGLLVIKGTRSDLNIRILEYQNRKGSNLDSIARRTFVIPVHACITPLFALSKNMSI